MSRGPGDSAIAAASGVTVGELRAWIATEVTRIKTDIDNLYDRVNVQTQQGTLTSAKIYEIDPIVQSLRERVISLEAIVRALSDAGDDGCVTELAFSEYKREVDALLRETRDDVLKEAGTTVTALAKNLDDDRKKLTELSEKVNGLVIKISIFISVAGFIIGKILEGVAKAYFGH